MKVFFVALARDASAVGKKINEIEGLGYPFIIVCGEKMNHPKVVYRAPKGKFDAVNFGFGFVPPETDVVAFNDVDTEIHDVENAVNVLRDETVSLVFAKVRVASGPQQTFYSFLDPIRRRIPVAASGELLLIRYDFLRRLMPLEACKAEDSYILFKVLENGGRVAFCEDCYVTTVRTKVAEEEEGYKRRTVGGIYQALSMSKPPFMVKLFYTLLPLASPLLLVMGKKGYYWTKGILLGYVDYARGDKAGSWRVTYT